MSDDEMEYNSDEEIDEEPEEDQEEQEEDVGLDLDPAITGLNHSGSFQIPLHRQTSFQVLEPEEIEAESKKLIREVMDVLSVPSQAAACLLLRHFNWNKEKLIERYMENSEAVCKEAGMATLSLETAPKNTKEKLNCLICYDEFEMKDTFALGCGHRYCLACWRNYLELKIKEGAECISTKCMNPKCKELVHDEAFKKLVGPQTLSQYNRFLHRSFVDDNPQIKWCPAPGCGHSIRCDRKNRKEAVFCKCGFRFCFTCCDFNIGDHMPASCGQVEKWSQKASDESENVNWMLANTKKCPQCRSPIEKNGGCMHMTCRKNGGGCGHEFCWLCRGPWSEHGSHTGGYYNCNKYAKSDAKTDDDKANDAKTELEYYMFYYHRYESHKNAMKVADDQRRNADKKGVEFQEKFDVRSADTKFLREATEQLLENRRVLCWSYVYGFYLEKSKTTERNLFEYLQEDLEKHTNFLSTLYETAADKIDDYQKFIKWKEDVTNYTRVTKRFLDHFVEGVTTGLTQERVDSHN